MEKSCGNCGNGPFQSIKCLKKFCYMLYRPNEPCFQNWIPKGLTFKQSCADVVSALKRRSKRGLSVGEWCDMGHGADLRKRISELSSDGYTFRSVWEPNKTTTGRHKRYFLVSCPRGR